MAFSLLKLFDMFLVGTLSIMENDICSIVRWHFKLFRIFSFTPISLSGNAKVARTNELLFPFWNLLLAVFFNVVTFSYFYFKDFLMYSNDYFGFTIDCIKLFTTSFTMQVSILEPLFKRKHEHAFWRKYVRLSSTRSLAQASIWTQVKEYKWFLLKFYSYATLNLLTECVASVSLPEYSIIIIFWVLFIPYTYFLKFRTMHFMFCLDLVTVEIQCLDKDLQLLVEYSEFGLNRQTFPKFDEFIRLRIAEKQKRYEDLYELVDSFKNSNGLAIIANYIKYYVRILVCCYWFYWTWYNSKLSTKDILLVPAILEIPMFLLTAKSCMNAAKYISYRVHNLKHSAENIATSIQIQNFSLQLLHQKIKIDGLGIVSMDGYMLTKAIGSITTYMVFFIQFMPKFKSKFD